MEKPITYKLWVFLFGESEFDCSFKYNAFELQINWPNCRTTSWGVDLFCFSFLGLWGENLRGQVSWLCLVEVSITYCAPLGLSNIPQNSSWLSPLLKVYTLVYMLSKAWPWIHSAKLLLFSLGLALWVCTWKILLCVPNIFGGDSYFAVIQWATFIRSNHRFLYIANRKQQAPLVLIRTTQQTLFATLLCYHLGGSTNMKVAWPVLNEKNKE